MCKRREQFDSIWAQALTAHRDGHQKLAQIIQTSHGSASIPMALEEEDDTAELPADAAIRAEPTSIIASNLTATEDLVTDKPQDPPDIQELSLSSNIERHDTAPRKAESRPWRTDSSKKTRHPKLHQHLDSSQLMEEQLQGTMPPSYDLEAYELQERPMTI